MLSMVQIRRSLDPVQKLKEGTRRIASRDFESRVTISTGDEFEELADSFNAMAGQLGRQFHTLASISEIDRAVLSSLDVGTIVETVLARVRDVFPCEVVSVTLRDAGETRLARTYLKASNPQAQTVVERIELTRRGSGAGSLAGGSGCGRVGVRRGPCRAQTRGGVGEREQPAIGRRVDRAEEHPEADDTTREAPCIGADGKRHRA